MSSRQARLPCIRRPCLADDLLSYLRFHPHSGYELDWNAEKLLEFSLHFRTFELRNRCTWLQVTEQFNVAFRARCATRHRAEGREVDAKVAPAELCEHFRCDGQTVYRVTRGITCAVHLWLRAPPRSATLLPRCDQSEKCQQGVAAILDAVRHPGLAQDQLALAALL
jgi:hypothetical protein